MIRIRKWTQIVILIFVLLEVIFMGLFGLACGDFYCQGPKTEIRIVAYIIAYIAGMPIGYIIAKKIRNVYLPSPNSSLLMKGLNLGIFAFLTYILLMLPFALIGGGLNGLINII